MTVLSDLLAEWRSMFNSSPERLIISAAFWQANLAPISIALERNPYDYLGYDNVFVYGIESTIVQDGDMELTVIGFNGAIGGIFKGERWGALDERSFQKIMGKINKLAPTCQVAQLVKEVKFWNNGTLVATVPAMKFCKEVYDEHFELAHDSWMNVEYRLLCVLIDLYSSVIYARLATTEDVGECDANIIYHDGNNDWFLKDETTPNRGDAIVRIIKNPAFLKHFASVLP